jgi:glycosyltransferase involved in cell wall biosynthesis
MHLSRDWQRGEPDAVRRKYGLPEKFLIFPGQFWKHKNHLTLFRAIRLLQERGLNDLVLVSTGYQHDYRFPEYAAELQDFLSANEMKSSVRTLGLIPREDQVQLMRAAAAVVHPSLFEGWSTVVDEAQALGKVVFASDIPMHREQLREHMHLFASTSAEELAELLARHWDELKPGPERDLEAETAIQHEARIRDFGRRFVRISRAVVEQTTSR